MKRGILSLYLIAFTLFYSCSDETTIFIDEQQQFIIPENNAVALLGSINFENAGVIDVVLDPQITGKRTAKIVEEPAGNYPLTLIAQVSPPTYGTVTNFTATHVYVEDDYAYVAYNMAGEDYFGAIDIINVADPTDPRVTSRVVYVNADINALQYDNGFIYAVGGMDAESTFTALSNSFITKIPVTNGVMDVDANVHYGFQPGDNATDIHIEKDKAFVTSGKNGTITIFDTKDLQVMEEMAFSDLRSLAYYNKRIALLDASMGIRIVDDNLKTKKDIAINSDFGLYTKRSIDFVEDRIIVAEGAKGAGVYSYDSGTLLQHIPILEDPTKAFVGDPVTNAVAINNEMVLMANGGAGLSISDDEGNTTEPYGVMQLEGSINYVQTKDDYAFAASGTQGLQIIKLNKLSLSLEAQCADLPEYSGTSKLVINVGEDIGFSGAKSFSSIRVEGSLLMCGSWTVSNDVDIKKDAVLQMKGSMSVGSNKKKKEIIVDTGGVLRVEGNLTIYGNLNLKDGTTLEFVGEDSVVNIFGTVKIGTNVIVNGIFKDVQNKF